MVDGREGYHFEWRINGFNKQLVITDLCVIVSVLPHPMWGGEKCQEVVVEVNRRSVLVTWQKM